MAWKAKNQDSSRLAQASVDAVAAQTKNLSTSSASRDASNLLVCHDFKGGYNENPFERGYSFEFW